MTPPNPSQPTTASPEVTITPEAQENDLKSEVMKNDRGFKRRK